MDNEQPHQELVKCVVVGDTAVGKTRLICARACNAQVTLGQLMTTHVPTVWAIDQYRINKEVLERSWDVVDGVSISLRLWDTFGDHDRDRRFAYGRSDVVLLCFSIANPTSLQNCKNMWYPEIRKFCPHTPIFLVGCKNDIRFLYKDPKFLHYFQARSPFVRPIREFDILTPDQGRLISSEIGAPYYETSVLTNYGVNCVFENVIRAALIAKRQQRFWMTNLKRVQRPLLQVPYCPPKHQSPEIFVPPSIFERNIQRLLDMQAFTDVIIVAGCEKGARSFRAHKFLLAAAVPSFYKLFMMDLSSEIPTLERRASDSSIVSAIDSSGGNFNIDTEHLIKDDAQSILSCSPPLYTFPTFLSSTFSCTSSLNVRDQGTPTGTPRQRRSSWQNSPYPNLSAGVYRVLSHAAFNSIHLQHESAAQKNSTNPSLQTVVVLSPSITPNAIKQCLIFIYCGEIDKNDCDLNELQQAAELLGINELQVVINNLTNHEEFLNDVLGVTYVNKLKCSLKEFLDNGLFSDVLFQLDGGTCVAHKPLLMAGSDVMGAMFGGDFRESSAKVVHLRGVGVEMFRLLLQYLYTDDCGHIKISDCVDLIVLANRLCLSRLVAIIEHRIVNDLTRLGGQEAVELAIKLLEPSQIHNADQLCDWCLHLLATNYNDVCRKLPKLLRTLHPENQAYLNKHRWPPVWYLKEYDHYDRCKRERDREEKPVKGLKRHQTSGCLCFSGKLRRNSDGDKHYSTM
ncbi:RHOBTB1 (predicted) [Pycnogonum litorale]